MFKCQINAHRVTSISLFKKVCTEIPLLILGIPDFKKVMKDASISSTNISINFNKVLLSANHWSKLAFSLKSPNNSVCRVYTTFHRRGYAVNNSRD